MAWCCFEGRPGKLAGLLWTIVAVLLGCLLVYRFGDWSDLQPRWAGGLLVFGVGTSIGIGLTSVLFFLARLALPAVSGVSLWIEVALLSWAGYEAFRKGRPTIDKMASPAFPLNLFLMAALILALAVVTNAMSGAWDTNPFGNWDAWSIWNLHARFLAAGGEFASRAWSAMPEAHPEYPLLVSSFVARCWAFGHTTSTGVPIATSYLFLLALVAMATGGMALLRSPSLGLLLGLGLLGTPTVLHEVPSQYADIPLACYLAGALVLMLLDRPILAGVLASMAAWTKDEGLAFLAVLFLATIILRRRHAVKLVAGALPIGILVLVFKTVLVRGAPSILGRSESGLLQKIGDVGRYGKVMAAFASEFAGMASGWYHPILPVIALALLLRFDRGHRRNLLFCGGVFLALLLADFAVYIITPYDLAWHLQTSLGRLFAQLWPCLLLAVFTGLRTPESMALLPAVSTSGSKPGKISRQK
jgi:hypothetical protein